MVRNIITGPMQYKKVKEEDGKTKVVAYSEKALEKAPMERKQYFGVVHNSRNDYTSKAVTVDAVYEEPRKTRDIIFGEKQKQTKMIIVVEAIKGDVLYLKQSPYNPFSQKSRKFLRIVTVLPSGKLTISLVDLNIDYSYSSLTKKRKLNHVSVNGDIRLSPRSIHKVLYVANKRLRNLELSSKKGRSK